MFDLFRSRAKGVRYLLGAMLLLVALSMVITLIPGFGTSARSDTNVIAEIGDDALTTQEVQRSLQMQLRGRSIPSQMAPVLLPQLIDQMVSERALAFEARRQGLAVTDDDLAGTVESIFPQLFEGGTFAGKQAYAAVLNQNNMTIPEFEENLRKQMLLNKLRSLAMEGTVVPPVEAEREFRKRNERVKIEYAALTPVKFRPQVSVSAQEIQDYFIKNRPTYRVPEKRDFQMLVFEEAAIAQTIEVPEAELRRTYEMNRESYRTPERVKVRHILLKTSERPKEEVPQIRARIEGLLKQIRGGADFAELARKNSEDVGTAGKGGDLDWIVRGQTVKAFEDAAFSMKPGQISDAITTEYGFHIVQVLDRQQAGLRRYEEVRGQLANERKRQLVYDRMQGLADQARAALAKDPKGAQAIGRSLGAEFVNVERAGAGDPIPQVGVNKELEEALFSMPKGEVTPVLQLSENKLAVAAVTEVHPARPAELGEVETQVREQLVNLKLNRVVEEKAREALEKAKAAGDLKKVAQSMGLEWKEAPEFGRNGAAEGLGAASYLEEAFTRNVGEIFGPVRVNEREFICKVIAKTPADMTQFAAQRDDLIQQLKSQRAQERLGLFEEGVKNKLIQDGKIKIHQDVINRMISSYRGS
jgi:peptidyl-prolyl cis-trans isomerase D